MGRDPATSESVSAGGATGARGGRRGRCWGSILSNCSYSHAGGRGRDGGGVFGGVLGQLIIARIGFVLYYHQSAVRITVFCLVLGAFLSSLVGEMDGKEREREEN